MWTRWEATYTARPHTSNSYWSGVLELKESHHFSKYSRVFLWCLRKKWVAYIDREQSIRGFCRWHLQRHGTNIAWIRMSCFPFHLSAPLLKCTRTSAIRSASCCKNWYHKAKSDNYRYILNQGVDKFESLLVKIDTFLCLNKYFADQYDVPVFIIHQSVSII
jgi:hypothetical protein